MYKNFIGRKLYKPMYLFLRFKERQPGSFHVGVTLFHRILRHCTIFSVCCKELYCRGWDEGRGITIKTTLFQLLPILY